MIEVQKGCFIHMEGKSAMLNFNKCNGIDHTSTSEILEQWDNAWNKGTVQEIKKESASNPYNDLFYNLVHESYWTFYKKSIKNRRKNFLMKFLLLIIALLFSVAGIYLILYGLGFWGDSDLEVANYLISETFLVIFSAMFLNTISKWISVKKYQETWNRHSRGLHNMQNEMLRYVCHLDPYQELIEGINDLKFKSLFIERMLKIWGENQSLFQNNLETKEETMEDYLKYVKSSK